MNLIGTNKKIEDLEGFEYAIITAYTHASGRHSYVAQNANDVVYIESTRFFSQGEVISMNPKTLKAQDIHFVDAGEQTWV